MALSNSALSTVCPPSTTQHQHPQPSSWVLCSGARWLVADRRFCSLLPKEQQLPPTPGMRPVPGKQWQSCNDACAEQGMVCYSKVFWWLNSCSGGAWLGGPGGLGGWGAGRAITTVCTPSCLCSHAFFQHPAAPSCTRSAWSCSPAAPLPLRTWLHRGAGG